MINLENTIRLILFILLTLFLSSDDAKPEFYKNIKTIQEPNEISVLVNKFYRLDEHYIPDDLEKININYANDYKYLRHPARIAFEKMSQDAKKLGLSVVAVSAFRSYQYQEKLYQYYVDEKGLAYADLASARPGHSEHQTGLTVDVMGSNGDYNLFEDAIEFEWVKKNAHKYGFILRYPKGKEKITGFKYEPWHYRYIGVEDATIIYQKQITLEEYKKEKA